MLDVEGVNSAELQAALKGHGIEHFGTLPADGY